MQQNVRLTLRNHNLTVLVIFKVFAGNGVGLVVLPVVHVDFNVVQHHPSTGLEANRTCRMEREYLATLFRLRQHKTLCSLLNLDSQTSRKILGNAAKPPSSVKRSIPRWTATAP